MYKHMSIYILTAYSVNHYILLSLKTSSETWVNFKNDFYH